MVVNICGFCRSLTIFFGGTNRDVGLSVVVVDGEAKLLINGDDDDNNDDDCKDGDDLVAISGFPSIKLFETRNNSSDWKPASESSSPSLTRVKFNSLNRSFGLSIWSEKSSKSSSKTGSVDFRLSRLPFTGIPIIMAVWGWIKRTQLVVSICYNY